MAGVTVVITEALISLFKAVLDFVYSLLPDWNMNPWEQGGTSGGDLMITQPSGWTVTSGQSPLLTLLSYLKAWNYWLPVDQLILIFNFFITYAVAVTVWRYVKWVIGIIRGAGTT